MPYQFDDASADARDHAEYISNLPFDVAAHRTRRSGHGEADLDVPFLYLEVVYQPQIYNIEPDLRIYDGPEGLDNLPA